MSSTPNSVSDAVAIPGYVVGTWKADPVHSEVAFSVRHLMLSKVRGRFFGFDATIVTAEDPRDTTIEATIELASVDTGLEARDEHLRSSDYLAIDEYPTMAYRSTGVRASGDGWVVDGDLALHGVTRPVQLAVAVNGFGADPFGGYRAGFSAATTISRSEFGIDLSVPLEAGGVVVGDKVEISLEIQAVLQK